MTTSPGTIYRSLWADPDVMVTWHDAEGNYKAVSPGAKQVIDRDPAEIIDTSPFAIIHVDDVALIAAYHQQLWDPAFNHEFVVFRIRGADGEYRWVRSKSKRGTHAEWGPVSVAVTWPNHEMPEAAVLTTTGKTLFLKDL